MTAFGSLVRKELMEEMLSSRGAALCLASSAVLSVFAMVLVSNTELSLLDNADALYLMCGIVLSLGLVIAVVRGSDGFAGERDRYTLEPLLAAPMTGSEIALAKLSGTLAAWVITFVLAAPYMWAVGSTGQNLARAFVYLFFSGVLLTLIFGGVALALSAKTRTLKAALSVSLALLLLAASPVILSPSLRERGVGRLVDLANPFAHGVNMLDSVVVDGLGVSSQLGHLAVLFVYAAAAVALVRSVARRVEL